MRGHVNGGANRASSASNSVLLLWQDFSLLVSDPSKILEDMPLNGSSV